jgi:hypothetical protein
VLIVEGFIRSGKTLTSSIVLPYFLGKIMKKKDNYNFIFHNKIDCNEHLVLENELANIFHQIGIQYNKYSIKNKLYDMKSVLILTIDEVQLLDAKQLSFLYELSISDKFTVIQFINLGYLCYIMWLYKYCFFI